MRQKIFHVVFLIGFLTSGFPAFSPLRAANVEPPVTKESLGSLVAKIDGRETPLAIGYHKVNVEIRDQIARTTIEQSFVNRTDARTEGVFYFPLPNEASIAGFGMWIGNELVEADVVEKARAREIFETILREKRDPGLLEWTDGNIFKARVFPIEARSEKRVKIVYTQLLPERDGKYTYTYPLQSEMLRQNPLREFSFQVTVQDEFHDKILFEDHKHTLTTRAGESHLKVTETHFTPECDFKLIVQRKKNRPVSQFIAHRRGEDGYFMLKLGAAQRETKDEPKATPKRWTILLDTSASMDAESRKRQVEFLEHFFAALGSREFVNLYAVDIDAVPLPKENLFETLKNRYSLGWTDWSKLRELIVRTRKDDPETVFLYIGDQKNVARHVEIKDVKTINVLGSFEAQNAVQDFLHRLNSSALENVTVEYSGFLTACVYPNSLDDIPLGEQGIVLGRYLPGSENKPKITVKYTLDGKEHLENLALAPFPQDALEGEDSSFLPRLWARRHLEHLLEQNQTPEVREQIVAMSESYHIMTPYTSFLVLETDADRERFAVKRRMQMRDGERFFAETKEKSALEKTRREIQRWPEQWNNHSREINQTLRQTLLAGFPAHPEPRYYDNLSGGMGMGGGGSLSRSRREYFSADFEDAAWDVDSFMNFSSSKSEEYDYDASDAFLPSSSMVARPRQSAIYALEDMAPMESLAEASYRSPPAQRRAPSSFGFAGKPATLGVRRSGGYGYTPPLTGIATVNSLFPIYDSVSNDGSLKYVTPTSSTVRRPALSPEVEALLKSLKRPVTKEGAIRITENTERFDVRYPRLVAAVQFNSVFAFDRTIIEKRERHSPPLLWWENRNDKESEEGIVNLALKLGRIRKSSHNEKDIIDIAFPRIEPRFYMEYMLETTSEPNRVLLIAREQSGEREERYTIDTVMKCVVQIENVQKNNSHKTIYGDFVEVAGRFWPRSEEQFDSEGKLLTKRIRGFEALSDQQARIACDPRRRSDFVQFFTFREPLLSKSQTLKHSGTLEGEFARLVHETNINRSERVLAQLKSLEALAKDKPGFLWVRFAFMNAAKSQPELRTLLKTASEKLVAENPPHARDIASFLLRHWNSDDRESRTHRVELFRSLFQDDHAEMTLWRTTFIEALNESSSFPDRDNAQQKILELYRANAEENRYAVYSQIQYAQQLDANGDFEAAWNWLEKARNVPGLTPSETTTLLNESAQMLFRKKRYTQLCEFSQRWMDRDTDTENHYVSASNWYLIAKLHLMRDRKELIELLRSWTGEYLAEVAKGTAPEAFPQPVYRRAKTVVDFRNGNMYSTGVSIYGFSLPVEVRDIYVELVKTLLKGKGTDPLYAYFAQQYFSPTQLDPLRQTQRLAFTLLEERAETLDPKQLGFYFRMASNAFPEEGDSLRWRKLTETLKKRWTEEGSSASRNMIFAALSLVPEIDKETLCTELLEQEKDPGARLQLYDSLFAETTSQPYSQERETKLFALLGRYEKERESEERELENKSVTNRFVSTLVAMFARRMEALRETKEQHRDGDSSLKPWSESLADYRDREREVRTALLQRLRKERGQFGSTLNEWTELRIACWEALLQRENEQTLENLEKLLDSNDAIVSETAFTALAFLGAQKTTDEKRRAEIQAIFEKRFDMQESEKRTVARFFYEQMLIAGGATETLVKWYRTLAEPESESEVSDALDHFEFTKKLAHLQSVLGNFPEAIATFERLVAQDELVSPEELNRLAMLYLIENRLEESKAMKLRAYQRIDIWQLQSLLSQRLQLYQQYSPWGGRVRLPNGNASRQTPPDFDQEIITMFEVYLEKSANESAYRLLFDFYRSTRDFRLMQTLLDSLPARTMTQQYRILSTFQNYRDNVFEEATLDEILRKIDAMRKAGKTVRGDLTPSDLRFLDLVDLCFANQAATLQDSPGPHIERATASLKSAWQRGNWAPDEFVAYSRFLETVVNIRLKNDANVKKATEQFKGECVTQFQELYKRGVKDSPASTATASIALGYANFLFAENPSDPFVISILEEQIKAGNALKPNLHQSILSSYVRSLQNAKRHIEAENAIQKQLDTLSNPLQCQTLEQMRDDVFIDALLRGDCETSLGKDEALFNALFQRFMEKALQADSSRCAYYVGKTRLILNVSSKKYDKDKVLALAKILAFEKADLLREKLYEQGGNEFESLCATDALGPFYTACYYVQCLENEPLFSKSSNYNNLLRNIHHKSINLQTSLQDEASETLRSDYIKRYRNAVAERLRYELNNIGRIDYNDVLRTNPSYTFPFDGETLFEEVAEETYRDYTDDGYITHRVAKYLCEYVGKTPELRERNRARALEMLEDANARGILELEGKTYLAERLSAVKRYEEALALWNDLLRLDSNNTNYPVQKLQTLGNLDRREEATAFLKEIDVIYRKQRVQLATYLFLAETLAGIGMHEEAIHYFLLSYERFPEEYHSGYQSLPGLQRVYSGLANAYSAQGRLPEAVEAGVLSALLANRDRNLHDYSERLSLIIATFRNASPDALETYIAALDAQAEQTGQDNPFVRRALARMFEEKGEKKAAIKQYRLTLELQANDASIYDALVNLCDTAENPDEAIKVRMERITLNPRHPAYYIELGEAFGRLENPHEQERAYTSMVETLPGEALGHEELAKIRETQKRPEEALIQWQQVAEVQPYEPTGLLNVLRLHINAKHGSDAQKTLQLLDEKWSKPSPEIRNQIDRERRRLETLLNSKPT